MTSWSLEALERLADARTSGRPARAKRMLVVSNPYATTMSERLRQVVASALEGRFDVDSVATRRRGHAIELCREAASEGYDVVVAFGGDGTVNEAANGLAGSATTLTCLPGGATNVFCRMVGIPVDVVEATEHLLALADAWEPRPIDLGKVNERGFTFAAGAGLDASVVERVDRHPALKARYGPWYFAESAVATFLERYVGHPLKLDVTVGGQTLRGVSVFVQNGPAYTYFKARPVVLAADAGLESGTLAGAVLERANAVDVPTIAYRALAADAPLHAHPRVRAFTGADRLEVRSADGRPVPYQVDGDYVGHTEVVRFAVAPGALQLVA